jgi:hypothetical protein
MTANFFTAMIIRSGDLIWISYKVALQKMNYILTLIY